MNHTAHTTPTRSLTWRTVDIIVAAVLAVALGAVYFAWTSLRPIIDVPFNLVFPPTTGLVGGLYLLAGPVGALIIRKPGAAIVCELIAAATEALLGSVFGPVILFTGLCQGIMTELVFALTRYRRYTLGISVLAGLAPAISVSITDNIFWNAGWAFEWQLVFAACALVSGPLFAGLGGWFVYRAIRRTGVLTGFASGTDPRPRRRPPHAASSPEGAGHRGSPSESESPADS